MITIRRNRIKMQDNLESGVLAALLPENSFPYVVHLLAHSSYFVSDSPQYTNTYKYVNDQ